MTEAAVSGSKKLRGSDFHAGRHSARLSAGGLEVYPRLVPEPRARGFNWEKISAGVTELGELLHGGLERGTVAIISSPSGVGKTNLGLQFIKQAAGRGEHPVVYSFEEEV